MFDFFSHSCTEEKDKWLEDLQVAVAAAKGRGEDKVLYPSLKSNSELAVNHRTLRLILTIDTSWLTSWGETWGVFCEFKVWLISIEVLSQNNYLNALFCLNDGCAYINIYADVCYA